MEQRALAGTRLPDHGDQFSGTDRQVQSLQHFEALARHEIELVQIPDFNGRRGIPGASDGAGSRVQAFSSKSAGANRYS